MMRNRTLRVKITSFYDTLEYLFKLENAVIYEVGKTFSISFNIQRSNGDDPDRCNVTLYNLEAPDLYEGENSRLELYAGYDGSETLLYKGDITGMRLTKEGADRGIYITCGDTVNAGLAPVNKSYGENVDYDKIVGDIFDSFAKSGGEIISGMRDQIIDVVRGKKTVSGLVTGTAKKSLVDILSKTNKKPIFQNNQIYLMDKKTGAIDDFTVILDSSNGLIGHPERGFIIEEVEEEVVENGKKRMVKRAVKKQSLFFSCLIIPDIIVGRRVNIDGFGDWVVQTVSVRGSTRTNDWIMQCEAI